MNHYTTIIIGAGLTGLQLAKQQQAAGKKVLILEKSKGLGGRIATRRIDEMGFDHGALKLNPSENFEKLFQELNLKPSTLENGIYLAGGMSNLAKTMAAGLEILREKKVTQLKRMDDQWQLNCEDQSAFTANEVILTAPVPQALELIDSSHIALAADHPIRSIRYTKALILLAVLKPEINPQSTVQQSTPSNTHRIYAMNERGLHPQGLVIQFSPDFSENHFEKTDAEITSEVFNELKNIPIDQSEIEKYEVKKWRYSLPLDIYQERFLEIAPSLLLTGDGFGSPLNCVDAVIKQLS
jgi:predicted NAD/FAD-dependent oxidoreductase